MKKKRYKLLLFLFIGILFSTQFLSFYQEFREEKKVEEFLSSSESSKKEEEYIAVLEIPKLNLKKGFYSYESKKNNVNKNIEVIETSTMPDIENGNLILASHSGTSSISYFKNLYKLEKGDIAFIYYKDRKYAYELIYQYNEKKDGTIAIRTEKNQTNLTLITCDKKNNTLQNVYIFKQING